MPIGWASYRKPCMKLLTFSCTNVWKVIWCSHASNSALVGSSPCTSR